MIGRVLRWITPLVLWPNICWADGGGPLLLIINFMAFLYGSIFIVLVEWWVYCKFGRIPTKEAFWASLNVNIASTLTIGFGLPFLLGVISVIFGFIPGKIGEVCLALGTWIFENIKYPKLTIGMTYFWLVVTFFMTVYYEKKLLSERLAKRNIETTTSLLKLSWYANGLTYLGLVVTFLIGWKFNLL